MNDFSLWQKFKFYSKRPIEVASYNFFEWYLPRELPKYFDLRVFGKENIPDEQTIFALNHTIFADPFLFGMTVAPRQIHYAVQYEGVYNTPFGKPFHWAMGNFPVIVKNGNSGQNGFSNGNGFSGRDEYNKRSLKRAEDYLKWTRDDLGFFVDGPSMDLISNGIIKPIEKRVVHRGAAEVSLVGRVSVTPVILRADGEASRGFFEVGGRGRMVKRDLRNYVFENGKVPYTMMIGRPIEIYKNYNGRLDGEQAGREFLAYCTQIRKNIREQRNQLYEEAGKKLREEFD